MNRWSLSLSLAGLVGAVAACSGGGAKADGATVLGHVQDEAGTAILATVLLDGDATNTTLAGDFTFAAKRGTSVLEVTAAGYRRVTAEILIGNGDNLVDITMVVCTPLVDAGCDAPTPTPTPTATPPNVVATFVGQNANLGGGQIFNWTGQADLTGTANTWTLGDEALSALVMGGTDIGMNECWENAAETVTYTGGALDHCVFWWDREGGGGVISGNPDAIFYVRIPGAEYLPGAVLTFADGMTAGYYEGNFAATAGSFTISDYALQRAATSGTLTIGQAGLLAMDPATITGQATFYIPNLP